jgi:signal transduction histidine kinase
VIVSLRREDDFIVIAVKDHGVGIPRDEQAKVFDRFHRVSTGLIHDVKGSGLGLSIVRHIVEAHGGRVTVESRPGEGSTFFLHLPIELASSTAVSEATAPADARRQPSKA